MNVGVLAVQGAVEEHVLALRRAGAANVVAVRTPAELDDVAGIVIPGGESTTISRLLRASGLQAPIQAKAAAGELAVLGTCAGMVLLADAASHDVDNKDIQLLALLQAEVDRNAFGRQRESFEADLEVDGIGTMPAVFIRAPVFCEVRGETRALARTNKGIVAAERGRILATAFHPELTPDARIHQRFLAHCAT